MSSTFMKTVEEIHQSRKCALERLFISGCASDDCHSLLLVYAQRVASVCQQRGYEKIVHRRHWPIDFEWCFPDEEDHHRKQSAATLRAALPAVEALVSGVAAFCCKIQTTVHKLLLTRSGKTTSTEIKIIANELKSCIEILDIIATWIPCSILDGRKHESETPHSHIFNISQWNCLRRNTLPILLLPRWHAVLRANVLHQCEVLECGLRRARLREAGGSVNENLMVAKENQTTHSTYLVVYKRLYELLTMENYLCPHQLEIFQEKYNDVHDELFKMKVRSLIAQAKYAMQVDTPHLQPDVALALAKASCQAWYVFDEADKQEAILVKKAYDSISNVPSLRHQHRLIAPLFQDCEGCVVFQETNESAVVAWQASTGFLEPSGFMGLAPPKISLNCDT